MKLPRQSLTALIVLDFFWSAAAFLFDWEAIVRLPFWALPFVLICPLYPLFLGVIWWRLALRRRVPQLFFALATIPSLGYGVLSFFHYPFLVQAGGEPFILLQIPWVWFYAAQSVYLLRQRQLGVNAVLPVFIFFVVSLVVQLLAQDYDYLAINTLSHQAQYTLLAIGLASATVISFFATKENTAERR